MLGANIRIAGPKGAFTRTVMNSQHVAKQELTKLLHIIPNWPHRQSRLKLVDQKMKPKSYMYGRDMYSGGGI